jgi:lipopolysaccharide transport system permease protein
MWMSALNVKYRDIRYVLPFLIQLWMFVTPIIYPLSFVPERWRWVLYINPLTGIIEGYRASLFGLDVHTNALAVSTVVCVLLLVTSVQAFQKMEREFADVI